MRESIISRLSATEVVGDVIEFGNAESGRTYVILTFVDESQDISIHDPRYDTNGCYASYPGQYRLTDPEVVELVRINEGLVKAQNDIVDSMANTVQNLLRVRSGDLASHHFDDEVTIPVFRTLAVYALRELQFSMNKPKPSSSSGLGM